MPLIGDEEIRNVALSMRPSVTGEVLLGLLDRIQALQQRVDALERGSADS